ncbi:MAG TPA: hypothetical protein PLL20_18545 [Phycisphaerae bacterium]|nr:hypothetical protein [Phycisphaerae bacterium]
MVGAVEGSGDLPICSPPEAGAGSGSTRRQVSVAVATSTLPYRDRWPAGNSVPIVADHEDGNAPPERPHKGFSGQQMRQVSVAAATSTLPYQAAARKL